MEEKLVEPHLIILFIVLPLTAGVATLMLHHYQVAQRVVGLVVLPANVAVAAVALATVVTPGSHDTGGILVTQSGNWPAPFGLSIVVDPLAALMLATSSVTSLAVFIYCVSQLPARFSHGYFHPCFHLLVLGVQWAFITGDLFNLFVAFEIMLMASYVLFVIGTTRAQMRQAYKYVLLNLLASMLFVTCCGWVYGHLGTLNMADITRMAMQDQLPPRVVPVIAVLALVFGGKSAVFPLWFWLPDTYHTLPAAIVGLFGGLLTKVGAYVMIRVFVMMFGPSAAVSQALAPVLLFTAGATMFLGVLGAVSMNSIRRILSIHIISQVGYMMLGTGLAITAGATLGGREMAAAGAIFFIIHNMVVKCCLFLCGGLMSEHAGSDDLDKIGGLLRRAPWLAGLFMLVALSLAGLPPLSGFFGKWLLMRETIAQQSYWLLGLALATSLLTLLSMLKIWSYGFWSPARGAHMTSPALRPRTTGGMVSVWLLAMAALSMGLLAEPYIRVSRLAARGVVDASGYVEAVLGSRHLPPTTVAGEPMP